MTGATHEMDAHELKKLGEELARALDEEGQPFFELKLQLGRLISHLESEQRVTVRMEKQIDKHERVLYGDPDNPEEKPGVIAVYHEIRRGHKRNAKLLWLVFATAIGPLVVKVAGVIFGSETLLGP